MAPAETMLAVGSVLGVWSEDRPIRREVLWDLFFALSPSGPARVNISTDELFGWSQKGGQ